MRKLITLAFWFLLVVLLAASSRFSVEQSASAGQGKGGEVVAKPTPTPKKTTTRRNPPSRTTTNTRTNPSNRSAGDATTAAEIVFWNSIKDSANPEDFRAYLKNYPSGQFADLANNRIKILEAPKPQPTATPTPTPTPAPEPAYEWTKVERDLPAPVRFEDGERRLSFSVLTGWTRTERGVPGYRQISFRAPDSSQTNISIQVYGRGVPHTFRNRSAEVYRNVQELLDDRRQQYASQRVSAKLTETEVIDHPTGGWYAFTADLVDGTDLITLNNIVLRLDAVYPDDVWETKYYGSGNDSYSLEQLKPNAVSGIIRTRHSYAIRGAGAHLIVMSYTAPIERFDERLLPSIMATMKMSNGTLAIDPKSSDSTIAWGLQKYELEILIDGVKKDLQQRLYHEFPVDLGKHRVTVRAKEHKSFEKEILIGGWEKVELTVTLERIPSGTSGTKPE